MTPLGRAAADPINSAYLAAPEMMDAEMQAASRHAVPHRRLEAERARPVVWCPDRRDASQPSGDGGDRAGRTTVGPVSHFTPALFEFLTELTTHNGREWFQANKVHYQRDVQDPLVQFVADFDGRLRGISPHMVADPRRSGGSVFRIYRDVRFSKDKSPYKTNAGIHFRHEVGREVHGPGLYLHMEPGNVFAGAGIWNPKSPTAGKIREAIVEKPGKWQNIMDDDRFASMFSLEGDSLKRAPRGFDPSHPHIEYLKLKSFVAITPFTEEEACSPGFIDQYADACRVAAPLAEFVTTAVGLDW